MGEAGGTSGRGARDAAGRFVKGRSGNPQGRPAIPQDVRQAAANHTGKAIALMAQVLDDETASRNMRFLAARRLLQADRGKGGVKGGERTRPAPAPFQAPENAYTPQEIEAIALAALQDVAQDETAPAQARVRAAARLWEHGQAKQGDHLPVCGIEGDDGEDWFS